MAQKFCQSCGMPMKMDPKGGGTNADGSPNTDYCSYCYERGSFRDSFTSAREMVDFVREKLKEQGMPGWKRWLFTLNIARLQRWKE